MSGFDANPFADPNAQSNPFAVSVTNQRWSILPSLSVPIPHRMTMSQAATFNKMISIVHQTTTTNSTNISILFHSPKMWIWVHTIAMIGIRPYKTEKEKGSPRYLTDRMQEWWVDRCILSVRGVTRLLDSKLTIGQLQLPIKLHLS